jgi:superfamily II DNA/RNA helicase
MHSEDYVHRIGRTGRAHAIGDAISLNTSEDQGPLRSLERFIGRGIVRKRAEGVDYNAAAPPRDESGREERRQSPPKMEPKRRGTLLAEAATPPCVTAVAVVLHRRTGCEDGLIEDIVDVNLTEERLTARSLRRRSLRSLPDGTGNTAIGDRAKRCLSKG